MLGHPLETIFRSRSIAVIGASADPRSLGYHFVRHLVDYGYRGKIYPVNPKLMEVFNLKAYPDLKEVPGSVDYVICCIGASKVLDLLEECSRHDVKAVHLFTGRLSETGRPEGAEVEKQILLEAKRLGVRILGPNCVGIYCPREGIAFGYDFPKSPGSVGAFFQSGGAATEFVRYASLRGVRFSKVISYGNALDLNEMDFLEYFLEDPETDIIVAYMEGVRDGRKFLDLLRRATSKKPVIILKGGRGNAGTRAAASHTAALAGAQNIWDTVIKQAGAVQAESLHDMIDLVVSFLFLPPIIGARVGIAGGGGGRSVLSADEWEEQGFNIVPLPESIRNKLKERAPDIWDWIGNPADRSMMDGSKISTGDILSMMSREADFDFLVGNVTDDAPFEEKKFTAVIKEEVSDFIDISKQQGKPLIVILPAGDLGIDHLGNWRWKLIAEQRARLIDAGIPVFPTFSQAAGTIMRLVGYYQKKSTECVNEN